MAQTIRVTNLYSEYAEAVDLLKQLGLWTLSSGPYFHTLLIHTLPPPSVTHLSKLLEYLVECKLNTDWAPLNLTRSWQKYFASNLTQIAKQEDLERFGRIGEKYPIYFGIKEIHRLRWPYEIQSACINEFVIKTFQMTKGADLLHFSEYYHDVYQLRDVLIDSYAGSVLKVAANTRTNLKQKKSRVNQLDLGRRFAGQYPGIKKGIRGIFADDPPFIGFLKDRPALQGESNKYKTPKHRKKDEESLDQIETPFIADPEGFLDSRQQFEFRNQAQANFCRSNVRSLADPNQLTLCTIVEYWRELVGTQYQPLLAVTFLSFLTGIQRDRWLLMKQGSWNDLTKTNLVLSTHTPALLYRIIAGATNFHDCDISPSEVVELTLSKILTTDLIKAIKSEAVNKDYPPRAFSKANTGPAPTINRIANSGDTLLRSKTFNRAELGLLSGKVPIQFRARNCYVSRNRSRFIGNFQQMSSDFWSALKKHHLNTREPLYKLLHDYLDLSETKSSTSAPIGSQLATLPACLPACQPPEDPLGPTPRMQPDYKLQIDNMIQAANQLELHLYWMLQYAFAQRPAGGASSCFIYDGYCLHKDKDSTYFSEAKILKSPDLINRQLNENHACRTMLIEHIEQFGIQVAIHSHSRDQAWHFRRLDQSEKCVVSTLVSTQARSLTERYWGYFREIERPNISRHQCSTFIHDQANETLSDIWLGHHIEGWDPYAPQSTISIAALETLSAAQERILHKYGFGLMRNPFSS